MATSLFNFLFRRPSTSINIPKFPYDIKDNPYRSKRSWPPDFTQLSQKHQFRLERRYKRRAKLKWARPNWNKAIKLVQWGSILFVTVYGVLFLDVHQGRGATVFDGVRAWYWEQVESLGESRGGRPRDGGAEQKG